VRDSGTLLLAALLTVPLAAQPFKLDLEPLGGKASEKLNISLNHSTLQFAAKFLDGEDPEDAQVKKVLEGIDSIDIRTFESKTAGAWTAADLDRMRNQLRRPEWSRMLGYQSTEEGETAEIYVREVSKKVAGVVILDAEPKTLTVVSIAGTVDLDSLGELSGHFGVPKLEGKRK
jgi:Domain of unknown function (DUF4252)